METFFFFLGSLQFYKTTKTRETNSLCLGNEREQNKENLFFCPLCILKKRKGIKQKGTVFICAK